MTSVKQLSLNLGSNTYSVPSGRDLDSGDDSDWWSNGGSYGQVSGGSGSGCGTKVCQNSTIKPVPTPAPKNNGRKSQSVQTMSLLGGIPQMDVTCYYQENTPGVEDPEHDQFLGCDYVDFYGNEISDNGNPGWDLGVHGGRPNQNAPACSGAPEAVADSFPYNGSLITITDVNSLWQGSTNVGWLYQGSDGHTYIQANYATQVGYSFGLSVGFASVGASTPGGYSGIEPYSGKPPGTRNVKCFTQGSSLG